VLFCLPVAPFVLFTPFSLKIIPKGVILPTFRTTGLHDALSFFLRFVDGFSTTCILCHKRDYGEQKAVVVVKHHYQKRLR